MKYRLKRYLPGWPEGDVKYLQIIFLTFLSLSISYFILFTERGIHSVNFTFVWAFILLTQIEFQ